MGGANSMPEVLHGICFFFSETGTEGGYWAFQDERHIHKNVPLGFCKKCGKYLAYTGLPPDDHPWCADDAHEERIGDRWDYEGQSILKDGDHLTIFSKDDSQKIVWSGVIRLCQYPPFTEHASGLWIHADQEGIARDVWAAWFFDQSPAMLIVAG